MSMIRLRVSDHAKNRMIERLNCKDEEVQQIAIDALNSEEQINDMLYEMQKEKNKYKYLAYYKKHYFVFGIRYNQINLITVYKT